MDLFTILLIVGNVGSLLIAVVAGYRLRSVTNYGRESYEDMVRVYDSVIQANKKEQDKLEQENTKLSRQLMSKHERYTKAREQEREEFFNILEMVEALDIKINQRIEVLEDLENTCQNRRGE